MRCLQPGPASAQRGDGTTTASRSIDVRATARGDGREYSEMDVTPYTDQATKLIEKLASMRGDCA
ncbi:MAG: hypothetical protein VX223_00495 [Myxococcota bacterium]|nr:hypothetical protein [Myxococcota bacterium]